MLDPAVGGERVGHVVPEVVDADLVSRGPKGNGHTQAHRANSNDTNSRASRYLRTSQPFGEFIRS